MIRKEVTHVFSGPDAEPGRPCLSAPLVQAGLHTRKRGWVACAGAGRPTTTCRRSFYRENEITGNVQPLQCGQCAVSGRRVRPGNYRPVALAQLLLVHEGSEGYMYYIRMISMCEQQQLRRRLTIVSSRLPCQSALRIGPQLHRDRKDHAIA
jgi:hypothetical protein